MRIALLLDGRRHRRVGGVHGFLGSLRHFHGVRSLTSKIFTGGHYIHSDSYTR